MTTPKRYRLLQSIYSPVGNEKCGTIKTDFEWTNQFPSLLGVGFSNLTEWFEPIPDEQTTKEGWSDEDMISFADRHSLHDIGEKELQKFKASKQSQQKEERCIIENKDLRIFTDKKEEIKNEAPSNTKRVECYFLSEIKKFSDGSVDYMIHVSTGISQEKYPLIKKANEAILNGERLYTQAEMDEAFNAAREIYSMDGDVFKYAVLIPKYQTIQDYLTTKNK